MAGLVRRGRGAGLVRGAAAVVLLSTTLLGVLESILLFVAFGTVGLRVLRRDRPVAAPAPAGVAEPVAA